MKDFIDRMKKEQDDLDIKISKIELFKTSSTYQELSIIEKDLLDIQEAYMKKYNDILSKRIAFYLTGGKL